MTDHLISPEFTIKVADRGFYLDGSFGTLKAIEQEFKNDIIQLQGSILFMGVNEIAKLIATAAGASGKGKVDENEVGQLILDELGAASIEYQFLKAELMTWLSISFTPKRDREKKSLLGNEFLTSVKKKMSPSLSPGENTSASPSESSDGSPASSGEVMSGS